MVYWEHLGPVALNLKIAWLKLDTFLYIFVIHTLFYGYKLMKINEIFMKINES